MRIFTKLALLLGGLLSMVSGVAAPLRPAAAVSSPATSQGQVPPLGGGTLSLFPNPSQGLITVRLMGPQLGPYYQLRLRNIIGQEVRTIALRPELMGATGLPLDLSDLPAGLYFYSLLVDNRAVLTKRLTLQ
ncbi:T9SS type A sorting domain-containing protein [uncultured Hymenobacter sp.]|uniref:T9SS type A sorting domain-containing protein n=1 Tax=uncultured Hymenobacter sp. TaxID=170016 RepID=UPI0035CBCBBB